MKSDSELVKQIQKNQDVNSSLRELVSRHSGLYIGMVNTYSGPSSILDRDELLKEKESNIYLCALKYEDNRNTKFSTFLGNQTKWLCLNKINTQMRSRRKEMEAALDKNGMDEHSAEFDIDFGTLSHDKIISLVEDPRAKKILKLRYIEGKQNKVMPWKSVSSQVDLSIQGCINVHNRTMLAIREKLGTVNG